MKSTLGWILAIAFGVILLLALSGIWMMGRPWTYGYGGMMGGYGYMHPFGWGWMILGWLIPVGVIILAVVGVVALINRSSSPRNPAQPPAAAQRTCSHCGKPAQADWTTCPYCGQKLD